MTIAESSGTSIYSGLKHGRVIQFRFPWVSKRLGFDMRMRGKSLSSWQHQTGTAQRLPLVGFPIDRKAIQPDPRVLGCARPTLIAKLQVGQSRQSRSSILARGRDKTKAQIELELNRPLP